MNCLPEQASMKSNGSVVLCERKAQQRHEIVKEVLLEFGPQNIDAIPSYLLAGGCLVA